MGKLILTATMALVLFSCGASASFTYRPYVLDANSYKGTLRGPTEKQDISLEECLPKPKVKDPCYVFLKSEIMRLKTDYLNMQEELKCWQSGRCKN